MSATPSRNRSRSSTRSPSAENYEICGRTGTECVLWRPQILGFWGPQAGRSEEHTSELQSLMRISYAVFCLKKKRIKNTKTTNLRKRNTNAGLHSTNIQTHKHKYIQK